MDKEKQREFYKELEILTDKYNLTNVVFAATVENKFIGTHGFFGKVNCLNDLSECVQNSARLYQSGREKMMRLFDDMAR